MNGAVDLCQRRTRSVGRGQADLALGCAEESVDRTKLRMGHGLRDEEDEDVSTKVEQRRAAPRQGWIGAVT